MKSRIFGTFRQAVTALALAVLMGGQGLSEPSHGIAMYGDPALPPDFVSLPHVNPDAPKGGRIVQGEVGSFDSLNPHILKGSVPWQLRFLAYESLMGRSYDEPFTLYGLLAESVETSPNRDWVEFTLRPEAKFSDGTPVTVEDVLWSYETLGTVGHPRYHGSWSKVASAEATGDRTVRFTFNEPDRELALIMGMRPILKKVQWEGLDFAESGLDTIPISTAPYVIDDFEPGRFVSLKRNPDYWGKDVPFMQGQANLDEIRMEFFADGNVMFEGFKGGILNTMRETNAQKWATQYDFPAVESGEIVKSEIGHGRPTGMTGLVMNTRRRAFSDWRVRDAMLHAFNFEFINQTLNDGRSPRIMSYFSNSVLGMEPGPAEGRVRELLEPFAGELTPDALEAYSLPASDGSERNRNGIRTALARMEEAGWTVQDGEMKNAEGQPFTFEIVLATGANEPQQVTDIFVASLSRLGITPTITTVDSAQFKERQIAFDFDMMWYQWGLSLSPGNEQFQYWGREAADSEGSRNIAGVKLASVDAMIETMLTATDQSEFVAATQALDRILTTGRYALPVWFSDVSWIAHSASLKYPDRLPVYGDWIGFQPDVWWSEE